MVFLFNILIKLKTKSSYYLKKISKKKIVINLVKLFL